MSHECKLTPELHEKLVKYIGSGLPICKAAALARISTPAVYEWIRRGEGRDTSGLPNGVEPFVSFALDVRYAQAADFARMHKTVHDAAIGVEKFVDEEVYNHRTDTTTTVKKRLSHDETNINAAKWALARTFPELYGQQREAITIDASSAADPTATRPVITIVYPKDIDSDDD